MFEDADTGQENNLCTDWIPQYLQPATQIALRAEMQKARAQSDVDGYIYAFEILGSFTSHFPLKHLSIMDPQILMKKSS